MSAHRGRRAPKHAEHPDERWLLTYSDMITLLMALFIVMWSVSVVNTGKFDELKTSLHAAFSHTPVLDGQRSILQSSGAPSSAVNIVPSQLPPQQAVQRTFRKLEQENLERVRQQITAAAAAEGLTQLLRTKIDERGLVIRLLTDKLLFDPGRATVKDGAMPLLGRVALSLGSVGNPVRVEGNTDDQPISTSAFHSNWELSAARATAVLEVLRDHGVADDRLSVAGYADQHPVATNGTADGRAANRRVDIVVLRRVK
jgi:chemotaxis protein MotB